MATVVRCSKSGLIIRGSGPLLRDADHEVTIAAGSRPHDEVAFRAPLPIAITALDECTFRVERCGPFLAAAKERGVVMIRKTQIICGFAAGLIVGVALAAAFPTVVHKFGHVEMVLAPGETGFIDENSRVIALPVLRHGQRLRIDITGDSADSGDTVGEDNE
jgi:hypothetical protein